MQPSETIVEFDRFLAARGLKFEAVIIGGAALGLLGVTFRETRDCDVLHPALPEKVAAAAREFASQRDQPLDADWLNDKPSSLTRDLPDGWEQRLQMVFHGQAIVLRTLGRMDLLRSKIFALCDRGIDIGDCIAMAPSPTELKEILPCLEERDGNPLWPNHVREVVEDLRKRLGHGV
jgi:hypothetical protein